jgi:hypothetical protein
MSRRSDDHRAHLPVPGPRPQGRHDDRDRQRRRSRSRSPKRLHVNIKNRSTVGAGDPHAPDFKASRELYMCNIRRDTNRDAVARMLGLHDSTEADIRFTSAETARISFKDHAQALAAFIQFGSWASANAQQRTFVNWHVRHGVPEPPRPSSRDERSEQRAPKRRAERDERASPADRPAKRMRPDSPMGGPAAAPVAFVQEKPAQLARMEKPIRMTEGGRRMVILSEDEYDEMRLIVAASAALKHAESARPPAAPLPVLEDGEIEATRFTVQIDGRFRGETDD